MKLFSSIGYVRSEEERLSWQSGEVVVLDAACFRALRRSTNIFSKLRAYGLHEDLPHLCITVAENGRARRPPPRLPWAPGPPPPWPPPPQPPSPPPPRPSAPPAARPSATREPTPRLTTQQISCTNPSLSVVFLFTAPKNRTRKSTQFPLCAPSRLTDGPNGHALRVAAASVGFSF